MEQQHDLNFVSKESFWLYSGKQAEKARVTARSSGRKAEERSQWLDLHSREGAKKVCVHPERLAEWVWERKCPGNMLCCYVTHVKDYTCSSTDLGTSEGKETYSNKAKVQFRVC